MNCIVSNGFIGFALMQVSLQYHSGNVAKLKEGIPAAAAATHSAKLEKGRVVET